jgi:amidase
MIIGKHFEDATPLRVAHAYEKAIGGFPTPAMPAAVGSSP